MIKAIASLFRGLYLYNRYSRELDVSMFASKRIAIVGSANSVMKSPRGSYIDSFDYVVRINRAPYQLTDENAPFLGSRTDLLFHSFYENDQSGGGPLNFALYENKGINYVVNPRNNWSGKRLVVNYYKKYLLPKVIFTLPHDLYKKVQQPFGKLRPTIGFTALQTFLSIPCQELYITGFTFFKTPYAIGYRDHLLDMDANKKHIASQGIHDPDLEFRLFQESIKLTPVKRVHFDEELTSILNSNQR